MLFRSLPFALVGDRARGAPGSVSYQREGEGVWRFRFQEPAGEVREVTYRASERRGGGKGKAPSPRRER